MENDHENRNLPIQKREREKERERDRQTDRQRERQSWNIYIPPTTTFHTNTE